MSINLDNVTNILLGNTPVEQIADSQGNVLWSATPVVLPNYFYVEDASGSDNTLSIKQTYNFAPAIEVFKSTDGTNWTSMGTTTDIRAITATIPANGKLYLKATTDAWASNNFTNRISVSGRYKVGGNIMSLLYGDNFQNQTTFPSSSSTYRVFYQLFYNNTNLSDASGLVLPATTLTVYCYRSMFQGCTSLTTAPALPATTMFSSCYDSMFSGCTSLTTAPALPATALAKDCYRMMFQNCTSLTTAPATLPATTLANNCYRMMFQNCTSLTTAPALPATTLADYCYGEMFRSCKSLTTAPELPAPVLVNGCYSGMFKDCTNLTNLTTYANDISASGCLSDWVSGVAAQGNFYNLGNPAPTYPSGASGIPSGWTEHTSL